MTALQRIYSHKDVDMLIAASTIVESAIANKDFLQSKRPTWQDPFFEALRIRIDKAIQNYLGDDNAKFLRKSTLEVLAIQAHALRELTEIKVQLLEDFKDLPARLNEILTQLGYKTFHVNTRNKDQETLINLLYQFKTNLTPELKEEIANKGIAIESLDSIILYADELKAADVIQEVAKANRLAISAEAIAEFNAIYSAVISIAKIAGKFYKGNPTLQRQFNFTKIAKVMNTSKKKQPDS